MDTITDLTDNLLKQMSVEDFFFCYNKVGIYDPVFYNVNSETNEIASYVQKEKMGYCD